MGTAGQRRREDILGERERERERGREALRARPDGTIMNGNHRIQVLRERGVDVDSLPPRTLSIDE